MVNRKGLVCAAVLSLLGLSASAMATFHTFVISEIFTSPDGTVQFIELREASNFTNQDLFAGQNIVARDSSGLNPHTLTFSTNLPSTATAGKRVLIATAAFAAIPGAPTPNYIIPANFLYFPMGRLQFAGLLGANQNVTYTNQPSNGTSSLTFPGPTITPNTPTNFAGATLAIDASQGACCLGSGGCQIMSKNACIAQGGGSIYRGDATPCSTANCPQPQLACCFANGDCQLLTTTMCGTAGGTPGSAGSTCDTANCPQPTGACCVSHAVCQIKTLADCAAVAGEYKGDSAPCIGNATCCPANINHDSAIDPDDLFDFLDDWFANGIGPCAGPDCHADHTGDGFVDPDDLFAFLDDWFTECQH